MFILNVGIKIIEKKSLLDIKYLFKQIASSHFLFKSIMNLIRKKKTFDNYQPVFVLLFCASHLSLSLL